MSRPRFRGMDHAERTDALLGVIMDTARFTISSEGERAAFLRALIPEIALVSVQWGEEVEEVFARQRRDDDEEREIPF